MSPKASRPRLGRSLAWGVPPPDPLGCAPCAPSRTGTRHLLAKREGLAPLPNQIKLA